MRRCGSDSGLVDIHVFHLHCQPTLSSRGLLLTDCARPGFSMARAALTAFPSLSPATPAEPVHPVIACGTSRNWLPWGIGWVHGGGGQDGPQQCALQAAARQQRSCVFRMAKNRAAGKRGTVSIPKLEVQAPRRQGSCRQCGKSACRHCMLSTLALKRPWPNPLCSCMHLHLPSAEPSACATCSCASPAFAMCPCLLHHGLIVLI